jgi:Flp pilus assembly protein TadB
LTAAQVHAKWIEDLPFNGWAAIWAVGLLLACVAAWLGSRWWAVGVLLIMASFLATMTLIFSYFG